MDNTNEETNKQHNSRTDKQTFLLHRDKKGNGKGKSLHLVIKQQISCGERSTHSSCDI